MVHQISNFSQIQKKSKTTRALGGGGGQENCGLYPLFGTFFISDASPRVLSVPYPEHDSCLSERVSRRHNVFNFQNVRIGSKMGRGEPFSKMSDIQIGNF